MAPAARLPRRSPPTSRSGKSLDEAIPLAQQYVAGAIRHAPGLGSGHGPLAHFWSLY